MAYYSDDEDIDVRVRHSHSPRPVRYVASPPAPRYYQNGPSYLVPEQHTTLVARSRSRERSRSRDRRGDSPTRSQPVIINKIYNDHSSDEDDRQLVRPRAASRSGYMSREDWENEQARIELERLRISRARDENERRKEREYRDEFELANAKRELDEIKRRESRAEEEKRIKKELELKRLREEEEAEAEKKRRDEEARLAVERYKQQEADRIKREKEERQRAEEEYKRRLRDDLVKSGLDEKSIDAIMKGQRMPEPAKPKDQQVAARPTYTRMRRQHLSIETLRTFRIDYDLDTDPEFILIKRWVPEWEQDQLWKHTRIIREKRVSSGRTLMVEEKRSSRREPEFEWVRKKERRRSKSPGLLMYLAGGRPT